MSRSGVIIRLVNSLSNSVVRSRVAVLLLALLCGAPPVGASVSAASVRGRAVVKGGAALPGVRVTAFDERGAALAETTSDGDGVFELSDLPVGVVVLSAQADAFQTLTRRLELGAVQGPGILLELRLEVASERVEVVPDRSGPAVTPGLGPRETLAGLDLQHSPSDEGDVLDALGTLPGVLRTGGLLSIRGGGPTQSSVVLGTMLVTDPASGEARLRLPVDAVAAVDVLASPASAEFGRFSSGIVVMQPQAGGDMWRFSASNLDPGLRFERGTLHVLGVRSFAPRVAFSGPLGSRVRLAQSFQYRYTQNELTSRPQSDTSLQEYLTSVTKLDVLMGGRDHLSLTLVAFPERRTHANLGTFTPPETTFDRQLDFYGLSLTQSHALTSSTVLQSSLHLSRQGLSLGPPEPGVLELQPEQNDGRHFNWQERRTRTWQWVEALSWTGRGRGGEHGILIGIDVLHADLEAESASQSVEIRRLDDTLARRVVFGLPSRQELSSTDVAGFGRYSWRPTASTVIEAGLRIDRDGVFESARFAPRVAAAMSPWGERLRLGGSFGWATERTPSLVGTFEQMEGRIDTRLAEDGITPLATTRFTNIASPGLEPAVSRTWTVELGFALSPGLDLRASALGRDGQGETLVEPLGSGRDGRLVLSSGGRSRYRELAIGLRYAPDERTSVALSWVRSRAEGDLNTFHSLFGNSRAPVVEPNAFGLSPTDVPNRVVARFRRQLGPSWRLAAILDWAEGFPFSAVNENLEYVGIRNGAGRFPTSALLDLSVEHRFRIGRWKPWLGLAVVNALNAPGAREVQSNITAPDFGTFYDTVPRRFKLTVRFGR